MPQQPALARVVQDEIAQIRSLARVIRISDVIQLRGYRITRAGRPRGISQDLQSFKLKAACPFVPDPL